MEKDINGKASLGVTFDERPLARLQERLADLQWEKENIKAETADA